MKSYTKKIPSLCFALLTIGLCMQAHAASSAKKSYLFVQTAQKAELTNQTLTLYGISAHTIWFTDRPTRKFGEMNTQAFVNLWNPNANKQGFAYVAPNAVMADKNNATHTLQNLGLQGLMLYAPAYDIKTGQLKYKITLQTGTLKQPVELEDIALFIDNYNASEIVFASTYVPFDSSF